MRTDYKSCILIGGSAPHFLYSVDDAMVHGGTEALAGIAVCFFGERAG